MFKFRETLQNFKSTLTNKRNSGFDVKHTYIKEEEVEAFGKIMSLLVTLEPEDAISITSVHQKTGEPIEVVKKILVFLSYNHILKPDIIPVPNVMNTPYVVFYVNKNLSPSY